MTEKEMKKLAKIFNKEFQPPFLEEELVGANIKNGELNISIGRRDIILDSDLNVVGGGTFFENL